MKFQALSMFSEKMGLSHEHQAHVMIVSTKPNAHGINMTYRSFYHIWPPIFPKAIASLQVTQVILYSLTGCLVPTCFLHCATRCCNSAMNLRECSGTTLSSWSPVSNSVAGYWAPDCSGSLILCSGEYL